MKKVDFLRLLGWHVMVISLGFTSRFKKNKVRP